MLEGPWIVGGGVDGAWSRREGPRAGVILVAAGVLVLGPSDRASAEVSRWVGIIAASLGAISAAFVMPYYPVWSLFYIVIAVMVVYGLSAHYGDQAGAPHGTGHHAASAAH